MARQVIDLGGDTYYTPRRNMVPPRFVRHFIEGYQGRDFSGKRKFTDFVDPLGGMGGTRKVEVQTDALTYYWRGQSLKQSVDKGERVTVSGDWLRANHSLRAVGEGEYRIACR